MEIDTGEWNILEGMRMVRCKKVKQKNIISQRKRERCLKEILSERRKVRVAKLIRISEKRNVEARTFFKLRRIQRPKEKNRRREREGEKEKEIIKLKMCER